MATNGTALVPAPIPHAGVIAQVANRYGLQPTKLIETLKNTIMQGQNVSTDQLAAFLVVANQYQLNPFTKEIYAFPNRGGMVPIVSIDGWARVINSQPALDGVEFVEGFDEQGLLKSATCKIYRKDRSHPTVVTEYLIECRRQTEPWKQWPARMLRHKAFIQCARIAFSLSGIYDQDEAERIVEATPPGEIIKAATDRKTEELKAKYLAPDPAVQARMEEETALSDAQFIENLDADPLAPVNPQLPSPEESQPAAARESGHSPRRRSQPPSQVTGKELFPAEEQGKL